MIETWIAEKKRKADRKSGYAWAYLSMEIVLWPQLFSKRLATGS